MTDNNETPCFKNLVYKDDLKLEEYNVYIDSIDVTIQDDKVKNIAVTGSYGSGKSSILRSYFKNNPIEQAHFISLASFSLNKNNQELTQTSQAKPQNDKSTPIDEKELGTKINHDIEKALLQQIFYSLDANKLKYSHIKRICYPTIIIPVIALLKIVFMSFAGLAFYLYFNTYNDIKLLNSPLFSFIIILLATIGSAIIAYRYSKRFNLNKLAIGALSADGNKHDSSPLNTYLDELIYFFRMHEDYNIFVFEDMDRFENPNIFVKLREINKAVNDYFLFNKENYKDSPRIIKFIYVLRDDVFNKPEERTKFFDAIISVVPFISYGQSSYEKIKKIFGIEKDSTDPKLELLKIITVYINDYRLMLAIYNDYNIYKAILALEDKLNEEKLLAMMIYKNCYPSDFEQLHYRKGLLFELLEKEDDDSLDGINNGVQYGIVNITQAQQKKLDDSKANGIDTKILEFLLSSRLIDKYYHLYISRFYEGDLTLADRDFLHATMCSRAKVKLEEVWEMPVENPLAVCEVLSVYRSMDRWLNVNIMDYFIKETLLDENKRSIYFHNFIDYLLEKDPNEWFFLLSEDNRSDFIDYYTKIPSNRDQIDTLCNYLEEINENNVFNEDIDAIDKCNKLIEKLRKNYVN